MKYLCARLFSLWFVMMCSDNMTLWMRVFVNLCMWIYMMYLFILYYSSLSSIPLTNIHTHTQTRSACLYCCWHVRHRNSKSPHPNGPFFWPRPRQPLYRYRKYYTVRIIPYYIYCKNHTVNILPKELQSHGVIIFLRLILFIAFCTISSI